MGQRKAKAPTIHDTRWKRAKALGLVEGAKPKTITPALKKRLYRYSKAGGREFEHAIGDRKARGNQIHKVTSLKVDGKTARKLRQLPGDYKIIKDRLIIDHNVRERVRVSKNFEGKGAAIVYKDSGRGARRNKQKIKLIEQSLKLDEFITMLEAGEIKDDGKSTYSVSIGDSAPFNVEFDNPYKLAYYLSILHQYEPPDDFDDNLFEPKNSEPEEIAPLITISRY